MAKSSSFFGMRRGSTKAHTFSVYRGSQITKDRVSEITNPQTTKQMQQRVKMPLVAAARSTLAGLVNHSFQGVEYGWQSKAKFSKLNLANLDVLSYGAKGIRTTGIANYQISEGSLIAPTIKSRVLVDEAPFYLHLKLGDTLKAGAKSLNDVIKIFLEGDENLKEGDQLTFVFAYYPETSPIYINGATRFAVAQPVWKYYRLVLKEDAEQNSDVQFEADITDSSSALHLGNFGSIEFETNFAQVNIVTNDYPAMFTIIVSRYDETNKIWQRSTNRMTINEQINSGGQYEGNDYIVSQSQAIETYLKGTSSSSDYYLNEGGTTA